MGRNNDLGYLQRLRGRYHKATSQGRELVLGGFAETTGYGRQHAGKLLRGNYRYKTKPIRRPRRKTYTVVGAVILAEVCALLGWVYPKRIQPQIGVAVGGLVEAGGLVCSKGQRKRLVKVSPATIGGLLKGHKGRPVRKGKSYAKPGTLLKTKMPIRALAGWEGDGVGFF